MRLRTAGKVLDDYVHWTQQPDNRMKFGLPGLDEQFRGIAPGEVALIIARSYVGKTNILCNIIANRLDVPQLMVSLEMPGRSVVSRLVAITYGYPYRELEPRLREGSEYVKTLFDQAHDEFENLFICDEPGLTIAGLCSAIEKTKPMFVTIDYLELFGGDRKDSLNHVVLTATALKDVAKEYNVAILCLHQVGRGEKNAGHKPLSMVDARYGGETQSDYVFGAYRPALDPELDEFERMETMGEVVFQQLKNRDGTLMRDLHYHMDTNTLRMTLPPGSGPSAHSAASQDAKERNAGETSPAPSLGDEMPGQTDIYEQIERARVGSRT